MKGIWTEKTATGTTFWFGYTGWYIHFFQPDQMLWYEWKIGNFSGDALEWAFDIILPFMIFHAGGGQK
jgi:hypothetical protein